MQTLSASVESSSGSVRQPITHLLYKLGPLLALVLLSLILSVVTDKFLSVPNLMNVLRQASINSLIACGLLLVILTAGIDLSVGPVLALSTSVMGVLLQHGNTNPVLLIVAGLCMGTFVGFMNGILLTKLHLPHPFISTIGMRNVARGLALLLTGAAPITGFPLAVRFFGGYQIGSGTSGFPVCFALVLLVYLLVHLMLNKTALGRHIYAVGGNPEAAKLSGIKVDRVLLFVYSMSGFMAAFGGLVLVGRVNASFALAGENFDMDAIASCIIGGASFFGGKGTMGGALIGAILIAVVRNGLNLLGASADAQLVAIGVVIILAVFVDVVRTTMEKKAKRMARA